MSEDEGVILTEEDHAVLDNYWSAVDNGVDPFPTKASEMLDDIMFAPEPGLLGGGE